MLDMPAYRALMARLSDRMIPDQFSEGPDGYTVNNLYLDTPDDFFIRNSLRLPGYKEKLRLRCYGIPDADTNIFFEIKKKILKRVIKRRALMTLDKALDFIDTHEPPRSGADSQVLGEIAYILQTFDPKPKVALFYNRKAFYIPGAVEESRRSTLAEHQDTDLRITFDTHLRARRHTLDFFHGTGGELIIPEDRVLMEVKVSEAIPLWLAHIFSEMGINSLTFSKYGSEYRQYLRQGYQHGFWDPDEENMRAEG